MAQFSESSSVAEVKDKKVLFNLCLWRIAQSTNLRGASNKINELLERLRDEWGESYSYYPELGPDSVMNAWIEKNSPELMDEVILLEKLWREENKGKFNEFEFPHPDKTSKHIPYGERELAIAVSINHQRFIDNYNRTFAAMGLAECYDARGFITARARYKPTSGESVGNIFKIRDLTDEEMRKDFDDQWDTE